MFMIFLNYSECMRSVHLRFAAVGTGVVYVCPLVVTVGTGLNLDNILGNNIQLGLSCGNFNSTSGLDLRPCCVLSYVLYRLLFMVDQTRDMQLRNVMQSMIVYCFTLCLLP